ncbi:PepSY-associated TM helix domain-containing protein [Sphingomonas psychrotolerans]|uniref:PepSY domain-containing protein n=1 Tax=Sphingomonas psychrotolerans TaxID=1327635 RepID=A0A2K8MIZ1_9SPHN|nr:PepSY-associated TM helix domain-containing protein [Sphingomonas psychrotolerans]ATY32964.1 PepSY domain-containing protein [Sphingomonas psychrotolerans]
MIHLKKDETKAMVAVHGWSGILLGLLLYAVVLTGAAAVFAHEIGAWSGGHLATRSSFEQPIDATMRRLTAQTPPQYREAVNLFEIGDHGLGVFFHRHEVDAQGVPTENGIYYQLDNSGRTLATVTGSVDDVFGPRNDDALSSFLVDTHVRLHVPNPWGLLLTGILGLAMLVAAISGLLIHRHLFKDIFTLRRRASPALVNRDKHSVAGTWSLPFAFVLAFTGSFFSFYGTIGVPVVAMAAFGGDVEALTKAVFGNPGTPDPRPAAMGNLDRVAADAIHRTGEVPAFIAIEKFGRADAEITSYHNPREGDLEPVALLYKGATAEFVRAKPQVGAQPSAGGTLVGIMGPLHFGNFAGMLSKAIWFGLGFAMCYVTYTGMRLWVVRRRNDARSLAWLERTVTVVGFGLPFGLVASAAAFLVTSPLGSAVYWTTTAFLIASGAAILAGIFVPGNDRLALVLKAATGGTMLLLPLLRLFSAGGPDWAEAVSAGQPVIAALDLAFMSGGAWLFRDCWRTWPRAARGSGPILGAVEA